MLRQSMWGDVSPETAAEITAHAVRRAWPPNATIFRQNDACKGLHLLDSGSVKLYLGNYAGREQILDVRTKPGPLTLLPVLDGETYAVSARTTALSVTYFVVQERFDGLLSAHADFAIAMARELARRTRLIIAVTGSISLKPVVARVAMYIREQAQLMGSLYTRSAFRLPLCQEQLAHLAGATRESVARALAELRQAGVIEQRRATVRVLNVKSLAFYCEDGERTAVPVLVKSGADVPKVSVA